MHGRLKVRTTEEERERKKKEEALKVKAYRAAMTKLQIKRQLNEYDDEMLKFTQPILQRNPDLTTLWNLRRLCVQRKVKELTKIPHDDNNSKITEQIQNLYKIELNITEQCLMVNPKSYGAWHHRVWSMENCPNPNWQQEMQLCTMYLKLDERNFHTWDYRRYVASKAGISKSHELDFCTDKIKTNFSNYSSWHYRSILLPILYPYEGSALPKRPMSEEKLKEELEMVLSAAFTDPNDSSAWFYQRWLLGYSHPALGVGAFRCDNEKAVVAFTKPILADNIEINICVENSCILKLKQFKPFNSTIADTVWWMKLTSDHNIVLKPEITYFAEINIPGMDTTKIQLHNFNDSIYCIQSPNPNMAYSKEVVDELQTQLDSCNSLLEFEPDSKWTLLTSALLMRAIDWEKYHEQSLQHLQKLKKVDSLRSGYYEDISSKWILEKLFTTWLKSGNFPSELNLEKEIHLTSLGYSQYFSIADEVKISAELKQKYEGKGKTIPTFKSIKI